MKSVQEVKESISNGGHPTIDAPRRKDARIKKVLLLSGIILATCIVFFIAGTLLFSLIFGNHTSPDPIEPDQPTITPQTTEELEKISSIQDNLSNAVIAAQSKADSTNADIIAAMNDAIAAISNDEDKRIAELRKLYLLTEGHFYDEAIAELSVIKSKYSDIENTCEYNIRGANLALYTDDSDSLKLYQDKVYSLCDITEVSDGE